MLSQAVRETDLLGRCRDGVVFLDTETDGLHWQHGHRPFIVGVGNTDGRIELVDLEDKVRAGKLRKLLEDDQLSKVAHNAKFDTEMLEAAGFEVKGRLICTMVLSQIVDPRMTSYKLKDIAPRLLNLEPKSEEVLKSWFDGEKRRRRSMMIKYGVPFVEPTYKDIPRRILEPYLRDDVEYVARLYGMMYPIAKKRMGGVMDTEIDLTRVLVGMEQRGIRVNAEYFRGIEEEASEKMLEVEAEIRKTEGPAFLWNSPKQLGAALIGKYGMRCLKKTDKGAPCFDADTLPLYDHPLARQVLLARRLHKLKGTYYGPIQTQAVRGTIHPSFRQHGAITGRFSCAEPNLQNIPRRDKSVRAGFVCRPGHVLMFADYQQIEMRLFAHYSESATIIETVVNGDDLHQKTADLLFGAGASKALRQVAKTLNFSILYGAGARRLRQQIRKLLLSEALEEVQNSPRLRALADMSETQARQLLRKYYDVYPDVERFIEQINRRLYREGKITDVYGKEYGVPIRESYKAANYLIQGTAAGVMKRALVTLDRMARRRREAAQSVHLVNTVHDEVMMDLAKWVWESRVHRDSFLEEVRTSMEDLTTFRVPITTDINYSTTSWAEKKEVEVAA